MKVDDELRFALGELYGSCGDEHAESEGRQKHAVLHDELCGWRGVDRVC